MALDSKDYIVLWWVAFVVVAAAGAAGAAWRRRLDTLLTLDRLSRQISGDPFEEDQLDQDPPPTDEPH